MRDYPMTDVIAEREYELEREGKRAVIRVQVGKPAPAPDTPHPAWYCPWAMTEEHRDTVTFAAVGEDSLQALVLALSGLRSDLGRIGRKGKLTLMSGVEGPYIELA